MNKYNYGYYTGKALLILAAYGVFTLCELNFNLLEWQVYSRLLFVLISVGLIFGAKSKDI